MGPPPPPPPPPPQPVLALRRGPSENAPRRNNNPPPPPPKQARPSLDAASLQHAAASLRKTVDGQQIRSDAQDLSNGPLDRQNQQLPGRDWSSDAHQRPLGRGPSGEEVYATPSRFVHPGPFVDLRGRSDSINNQQPQQPPPPPPPTSQPPLQQQTKFTSFRAPTVTIQPPSEPSVYSNTYSNYNSQQYSNQQQQQPQQQPQQYSVPSTYSPTNAYTPTYAQPSPNSTRNVTVTQSYSYETPGAPAQTKTYHYSSQSSNQPGANNNYVNSYSTSNVGTSPIAHSPTNNNNYHVPQKSPSPYITDARSRIHNFATTTSVEPEPYSVPASRSPAPSSQYSFLHKMSSTSTSATSPRPPSGNDFAKELRDQARSTLISLLPGASSPHSGLTDRQRYANQFQKTTVRENQLPISATDIYQKSYKGDEVDRLVDQMNYGLQTGYGRSGMNVCVGCNEEVTNDKPGCTAMDKIYHVACFKCKRCGSTLAGTSFYNVDGDAVCEKDYQDSLERCNKCGQAIADKLLRACGGAFHVDCFTCTVCNTSLDGVPFTVDKENKVHCVPCYHKAYAPRCAVCSTPIVPQEGEKESVRVVAMDKSFHVECYKCEDCGLQLSSKIEGQGCYPIDQHLFCKTCNSNRLRLMSSS